MNIEEMKTKLSSLEEQKTRLETAYMQLIGQVNLMKSLITDEEKQNSKESK